MAGAIGLMIKNHTYFTDLQIITVLIIITNISVIINFPYFRQLLTLICLFFIPGYLIIQYLQIKTNQIFDKFLLSLGVSLAFLMFSGLILSIVMPILGYSTPLAPISSTTIISIVLFFIIGALFLKKNIVILPLYPPKITNIYISTLLFPLLLPLIAIIGAYQLNQDNNNFFTILLYILIAVYICMIYITRGKNNLCIYPVALGCIAISVLFSRSLISGYLIGGDIYAEFFSFKTVLSSACWPGTNYHDMVIDSLDISILPALLSSISGLDPLVIFKWVMPVIIAIIPILCYRFFVQYFSPFNAFLSAIFIIFQIPFLTLLTSQLRVGIAILFFMYTIYIFLDTSINKQGKTVLLILFMLSVVFSYYATPIIMLIIFMGSFIIYQLLSQSEIYKAKIVTLIILLCVSIYIWWGLSSSGGAFNTYIINFSDIISNMGNFFTDSVRSNTIQQMSLNNDTSYPYKVSALLNVLSYLILSIGVLHFVRIKVRAKTKKEDYYAIIMLMSLLLLVSWLVLPYISVLYGAQRALLQLIVIIAPALIIGTDVLFKAIRIERYSQFFVTLLLIALLFTNSYLLHYSRGISENIVFDKNNEAGDLLYVYNEEVTGAQWLIDNGVDNENIYIGSLHHSRGLFVYTSEFQTIRSRLYSFRELKENSQGYILLRKVNIDKNYGFKLNELDNYEKYYLSNYSSLLETRNIIYQNRYCRVYK